MQRQLPLRYIVGSLFHRKGSAGLTLFSFFLVTLIWISLQAILSTIDQTLQHSFLADRGVLISKQASAENQSRLPFKIIHQFEGLAPLTISAEGKSSLISTRSATTYANHQDKRSQLSVRGLSFDKIDLVFPEFELLKGELPDRYSSEALLGSSLVKTLSLTIGDTLFAWRRKWTITGVFGDNGSPFESELWIDEQSLFSIFEKQEPTSAWFRVSGASTLRSVQKQTEQWLNGAGSVMTDQEFFSKKSFATEELRLLVGFVSLILSTGAVLSSLNTLYASLSSREAELATFRAIGFQKSAVVISVLFEALLISLAGGLLAVLTAALLDGISFRTLISGIGYLSFTLQVEPEHQFSGMIFALLMGGIGGVFPARQSIRKPTIESLQRASSFILVTGTTALLSLFLGLNSTPSLARQIYSGVELKSNFMNSPAPESRTSLQDQDSLITLEQLKEQIKATHPTLKKMQSLIQQNRFSSRIERLNRWPSFQLYSQVYLLSEPVQYPRADAEGNLELISEGKPTDFILRAEVRQSLNQTFQSGFAREKLNKESKQLELEEKLAWIALEIELESQVEKIESLVRMEMILSELILKLEEMLTLRFQSVEEGLDSNVQLLPLELKLDQYIREKQRVLYEKEFIEYSISSAYNPAYSISGITAEQVCCLLCEESVEEWNITQHPYLEWFDLSVSVLQAEQQQWDTQLFPDLGVAGRLDYTGPSGVFGVDLPGLSPLRGRMGLELRFHLKESRIASLRKQQLESKIREIEIRQEEWTDQIDQDVRQILQRLKTACEVKNHHILAHEQKLEYLELSAQELDEGLSSLFSKKESQVVELEARLLRLEVEWEVQGLKFELARLLARPPSTWSIESK